MHPGMRQTAAGGALALVAGLWLGDCFGCPGWLVGTAFGITVIFCLWQLRQRRSVFGGVLCLFLLLGILRAQQAAVVPEHAVSRFIGTAEAVQGVVTTVAAEREEDGRYKVRYQLAATQLRREGSWQAACGGVSVTVRQPAGVPLLQLGDTGIACGELREVSGYRNPGGFDYAAKAQREGLEARMVAVQPLQRTAAAPDWQLAAWREAIRHHLRDALQSCMPASDAAVIFALLFGGYEGIPPDIVKTFSMTGLVHILSVSGSHISLLLGVLSVLLQRPAARWRWPEWLVPALAALVVTAYGVLAGGSAPVVRAVGMGYVVLGAVVWQRTAAAGHSLCLIAAVMLFYQPQWLHDISFQLSFAATGGLVWLYPATQRRLIAWQVPPALASLLAVTFAAQLGVLPWQAWYFNSLSLSSLAANVIVLPLLEIILLLGLLGSCLAVGWLWGGKVIWLSCSLLLGVAVGIAKVLAALPFSQVFLPTIGLSGGALYYVCLGWGYGYWLQNVVSLEDIKGQWRRWSMAATLILLLVFIYQQQPRPLEVHFIDVGQGDAALIITPHRQAVLIDCGGLVGEAVSFDVGERVVVPYLRHQGIRELAFLVLTHSHQDHAGGAAAVAKALPVARLLVADEPPSQALLALRRAATGCEWLTAAAGQAWQFDGAELRVVYAAAAGDGRQANEYSTVLQVQYGQQRFLFTGDLPGSGEAAIVAGAISPQSTVLKVGHHGSRTSSTEAFLAAVQPAHAVISVGRDNRFGHPHRETLARLAAAGTQIWRTDWQGAIRFTTDGSRLWAASFVDGGW